MGKKGRKGEREAGRGGGKKGDPFRFLGNTFEGIDRRAVKRHLLVLVLVSLATKLVVLYATTAIFQSFIDLFDIQYYFQNAALPLLQGKIPYLGFGFDYPVLVFIPIVIALVPALATQSTLAFVYSFQLLMILCDLGTLLCVYLIALRVWNEKAAWCAGLTYATAFSASYFVLTKYDAFPTLLLMVAVLFTVYEMKLRGYLSATLGFFAKIFPAIALPFMVLYNARTTSLRQEIVTAGKVILPLLVVLLLPFLILRPESISTYLFATGTGLGVYANSATYTLYAYLHEILRSGISAEAVSLFMYAMLGVVLLFLLYLAYTDREGKPQTFLKILLCAVFSLVFFTKFRSPQYIVWFTPFFCLLVTDDPVKILLFYLTQVFGYIEFPLLFGNFYVNLQYTSPPGSAGWYMTLAFFSLEYLALLALLFMVLRPQEGMRKKLRGLLTRT